MGFSYRAGLVGVIGSILAMGAAVLPTTAIEVSSGYSSFNPSKSPGLNIGTQMIHESAAMANLLGVGARHSGGYVKHRNPGERAHRRWRHARASGRKDASRG